MAISRSLGATSFISLPSIYSSPPLISSRPAHPQGSGLAAAGGAYQHDELLVRNVQAELLHCQHALIRNLEVRLLLLRALFLLGGFLVGIDLFDVFQNNFCHDIRLWKQRLRSCSLTAGRGRLCGRSPHCRTASQAGFSSFFRPAPGRMWSAGADGYVVFDRGFNPGWTGMCPPLRRRRLL